jgi:hypothetical protein
MPLSLDGVRLLFIRARRESDVELGSEDFAGRVIRNNLEWRTAISVIEVILKCRDIAAPMNSGTR